MIREEWDAAFKQRMGKNYDEMKWLYEELYHDDQAFDYYCDMLYRMYQARSASLKKWDEKRTEDPSWYKSNKMLGYVLYVNAFDKTINGVAKHMDYLKEMGVNYLHLMPLLKSPKGKSDGGYAVSDFTQVEPELGTMEDLDHLTNLCHENGMSVCLDFVMNHTSDEHAWALKAKKGEKEYQDRYYFFDNWTIPREFEKSIPDVFPTTAPGSFTWVPEVKKVVMTMFYPYQWDLNYRNPTVFNDMNEYLFNLLNQGIDIVRLDAVPYIWKKMGTDCRNQPQVHTLVRIMHIAAQIVAPGTLLLGEVVMEPSKVVAYFGTIEKPECDLLYNVTTMASTWNTVATRDVRLLRHQMDAVCALPSQYSFQNYLRCHDDIGWGLDYDYLAQFGINQVAHKKYLNDFLTGKMWGSDSRGELYNDDPRLGDARLCGTTASLVGTEAAVFEKNEWKLKHSVRLDLMLHAFLLTQSGIPCLYSGDEIGQLNDYSYHNDPEKADDSRYIHRGNFNWNLADMRYDQSTRQGMLFVELLKLIEIRKAHPVFNSEADTWTLETYNDHILGFGRFFDQEKLIGLFNFSESAQTAWINQEEDYIDLVTGAHVDAHAVTLDSHDFIWLYHDYTPKKVLPEKKSEEKKPEVKKEGKKK